MITEELKEVLLEVAKLGYWDSVVAVVSKDSTTITFKLVHCDDHSDDGTPDVRVWREDEQTNKKEG